MNNSTKQFPLADHHVVTLALNVPGPVAASRLQELGARTTKVEPPWGDPLSTICPAWYEDLTRDQTVVPLNLKEEIDRQRFDEILRAADILITSFRPEAFKNLGLGWNDLHKKFPRLCQVAIVGFAYPRSNEPGHDLTYQANYGLVTPPELPRTLIADIAGAERTFSCALKLLYLRERQGVGSYEEVSLADSVAPFSKPLLYGLTRSGRLLGGGLPTYNIYRTSDGWVALAALEKPFADRLKNEFHLTELTYSVLQELFQQKTSNDWETLAQEKDLPIAAIAVS